jgi:hypothetical protein
MNGCGRTSSTTGSGVRWPWEKTTLSASSMTRSVDSRPRHASSRGSSEIRTLHTSPQDSRIHNSRLETYISLGCDPIWSTVAITRTVTIYSLSRRGPPPLMISTMRCAPWCTRAATLRDMIRLPELKYCKQGLGPAGSAWSELWVPETLHASCDLLIFVEQATKPVTSSDVVCLAWCVVGEWS